MDTRKCAYCEAPFPPGTNKKRKFCKGKQCKTRWHEKKKGLKPPFKPYNQKYVPPKAISQPSTVSPGIGDRMEMLVQLKAYWTRILKDAESGTFYLATAGLTGAGLTFGKGADEKKLFALAGFIGGLIWDTERKEKAIANARLNLSEINLQIRQLNQLSASINTMVEQQQITRKSKSVKVHNQVLSSDEYRNIEVESITLTKNTVWKYLLGNPRKNFQLALSGDPGSGKSTFAVKLAEYFNRNHGQSIYINAEQRGVNKDFQDMINRYNTTFKIDTWIKERKLEELATLSNRFDLVVLDSIQDMDIDVNGLKRLAELAPNTAFVSILHNTKDGRYKGSSHFAHYADIHIEMVDLVAHVKKSRCGSLTKAPIDDDSLPGS